MLLQLQSALLELLFQHRQPLLEVDVLLVKRVLLLLATAQFAQEALGIQHHLLFGLDVLSISLRKSNMIILEQFSSNGFQILQKVWYKT